LFILKFNESDISSEYIKCFLDSEKGQNELRRFSAGATTPVLHIQNINKILIPVHEQNVQKQMNKKAEKIVEELINAYESIDRNKKIINLMYK
jgi:restriction endonuclease S subunit